MPRTLHYIGFRDDAFARAVRIFAGPVMIHLVNDRRAQSEIDPDMDLALYAGRERPDRVREIPGQDVIGTGYDRPEDADRGNEV